jgi:hypothetical protein
MQHNLIRRFLVDIFGKLRKLGKDEIWIKNEINLGKFRKEKGEPTLGEEAKQKPNIQFWLNTSEENDMI